MALTRRSFIHNASTLAATGAAATLAGKTLSANTAPAPVPAAASAANIINVGIIGLHNQGWWDGLGMFIGDPNVRINALCDVDKSQLDKRAAELLARQQKHNRPQRPAALLCSDYRRLLDSKEVDVVVIGTPDHWHALQFVDACKAGKDIYVQKPFANSIAECDVMVEAARKYGRVVQVGQQQRGGAYWRDLIALIKSGWLGRVNHVHVWANFSYVNLPPAPADSAPPAGVDYDMWLGPAPARPFNTQRFHGSWRNFWAHGGGLITDWGVHLMDIVLWALNVNTLPAETFAHGGKFLRPDGGHETHDTLAVTYRHKDFVMTWENDASDALTHGRVYGICFRGTNGYIVANRSGWEAKTYDEKVVKTSAKGDGWENTPSLLVHTADFIKSVRARDTATTCPPAAGALCAKYAHLGNIAARLGAGTLVYDDAKKTFNDAAADALLRPTYRKPWAFPKV